MFVLLIFLLPIICTSFFLIFIFAPVFFKVLISVLIISGITFLIFKFPWLAAAAIKPPCEIHSNGGYHA